MLSIYLDAQPGALRAASIEAKSRLGELQRRIAREGPPQRARAVRDALAKLAGEIERLTDPARSGPGRVLFAAIGEAWLIHLLSQMPVSTRVVLDRSRFIHPLLALLEEGGPWGVVLASRTEARLPEWRLGELTPLRGLRAELAQPPHDRSGPLGLRPGNGYGTPTGGQRNARARDRSARFVERPSDPADTCGACGSRAAIDPSGRRRGAGSRRRCAQPLLGGRCAQPDARLSPGL